MPRRRSSVVSQMKCLKCLFLAKRAVHIDVLNVICRDPQSSDMCWVLESCDRTTSPSGKTSAFHLQRHHQRLRYIFSSTLSLYFIDFFCCHSTCSDFSSFPGKRRTFLPYLQSLYLAFTWGSALNSSHFLIDARTAAGDKKPQIRTVKELLVVHFDQITVLCTSLRLLAVHP